MTLPKTIYCNTRRPPCTYILSTHRHLAPNNNALPTYATTSFNGTAQQHLTPPKTPSSPSALQLLLNNPQPKQNQSQICTRPEKPLRLLSFSLPPSPPPTRLSTTPYPTEKQPESYKTVKTNTYPPQHLTYFKNPKLRKEAHHPPNHTTSSSIPLTDSVLTHTHYRNTENRASDIRDIWIYSFSQSRKELGIQRRQAGQCMVRIGKDRVEGLACMGTRCAGAVPVPVRGRKKTGY